jgi:hypothetical protein
MKVKFMVRIGDWKAGEVVDLPEKEAKRQVEVYRNAEWFGERTEPKAAPPVEKPKRKRRTAAFFTDEPKTEEGDE